MFSDQNRQKIMNFTYFLLKFPCNYSKVLNYKEIVYWNIKFNKKSIQNESYQNQGLIKLL